MLKNHIQIERRFASSDDKKNRDLVYLENLSSQRPGGERWSDLLKHKCVVVLGEGKCGKTHEFKQQDSNLKQEGIFSLFIALELLQDQDFVDTISQNEEQDLENWLNESEKEGFIFLDAVDELKLRKGALKGAIRKIIEALGGQTHRVRFFISCRPLDWSEELDLETVTPLSTTRESARTTESVDGSELFSSVVAKDKKLSSIEKESENRQSVKVVALLPLTRDEALSFAELYAPNQVKDFETHLDEKELWHLYQLPAEIISGLDQLTMEGQIGNLQDQLSLGIAQKLREPSDKKRNNLTEAKAMEGAERLALALFLLKRRSMYFNSSESRPEGISIEDILSDWPSNDQIELLGKPLFEPTGVGAVRFHHRSIQEFLAAKRLKTLRDLGLSTHDVFDLLFSTISDQEVVIPSMEPLVAWLAMWNNDILAEVKKRNPILLFRQGMPALLNIELRAQLLSKFVDKYAGGGWRRIEIGHQELKRVADQGLSDTVRELWNKAYTGHDTRELLIDLVHLTPMENCADLVLSAAIDESLPSHHRAYAIWAVLKCGSDADKQKIGENLKAGVWPQRLIKSVIAEMIPDAIDIEYFLEMSLSIDEDPNSIRGFEYSLIQTMNSDRLSFDQKLVIRDHFTSAIWDGRKNDCRYYKLSSKYDHLTDVLIALCWQTKPSCVNDFENWAWSLAIAFHFRQRADSINARDDTEKLTDLLTSQVSIRKAYFDSSFKLVNEIEGPKKEWNLYIGIIHNSLLTPFTEDDFEWLIEAIAPNANGKSRGTAFFILSRFILNGENPMLAEQIKDLISDRSDLLDELEIILSPPEVEPNEHDLEHQQWKKENEEKEIERIKGWSQWRENVLSDAEFLLDDDHRENTLHNLYIATQFIEDDNNNWARWNPELIVTAFSIECLKRVQAELSVYWRSKDISLYSERSEDNRNSFYNNWLMVLWAIKSDASSPDFVQRLSHEEALKAVRASLLELNGFASYLSEIETSHPEAVREVFSNEIKQQISILTKTGTAPIFHEILYRGSTFVKKIASNTLTSEMSTLEEVMKSGNQSDISYILDIIVSFENNDVIEQIVAYILGILDKEETSLTNEERNFWFQRLAKLDIETLCERILAFTSDTSTASSRDITASLFAAVFGQRLDGVNTSFDDLPTTRRLDFLKKLVIRAYKTILPEDDREQTGAFTPGVRDDAEQARRYLLENLATTKSPRALANLIDLSSLPEFSHFSDRLKQMAAELAGKISEPEPMDASTFRKFDQEQNYLPYNKQSLFTVLNNRLKDLDHHLINDEFSTIDTLRKVREETGLRRFISNWLNQNSRGAYAITQESVVVSEKRTDIRLHSSSIDQYASIEAKVDDSSRRWSGRELQKALTDQLVGRYLNHERCKVGCLLICMREPRRWQNPETRKLMDLQATVFWLQKLANEIMEESPDILISIIGLDYSATANE